MSCVEVDGHYFTEVDRGELGQSRMLCIPFGFPSRDQDRQVELPDFLMNLTLPPPGEDGNAPFVSSDILRAVTSKVLSGVSALIDRRMKQITEAMSAIRLAHLNADTDLAVQEALRAVLPHFVLCEGIMWIVPWPRAMRFASAIGRTAPTLPFQQPVPWVGRRSALLRRGGPPRERADRGRPDTALILDTDLDQLNAELQSGTAPHFRSLLIGRVHNRNEPDRPRGYVVLANRMSDLAELEAGGRSVPDWFDWEDELYLDHICAVLDLIAELFTAEESRFNRAQICTTRCRRQRASCMPRRNGCSRPRTADASSPLE